MDTPGGNSVRGGGEASVSAVVLRVGVGRGYGLRGYWFIGW